MSNDNVDTRQRVAVIKYREALAERGMSIRQFCKQAEGWPRSQLARYHGDANLLTDTIAKLAADISKATGVFCHPSELLTWDDLEPQAERREVVEVG